MHEASLLGFERAKLGGVKACAQSAITPLYPWTADDERTSPCYGIVAANAMTYVQDQSVYDTQYCIGTKE